MDSQRVFRHSFAENLTPNGLFFNLNFAYQCIASTLLSTAPP
jgi:hypothetical protein